MGANEVRAFSTYLAVNENVATTTQNQAMFALLFLYKEVFGVELNRLGGKFTYTIQSTRVYKTARTPVRFKTCSDTRN